MGIFQHKRTGAWIAQAWDPTKGDGRGGNVQVGSFTREGPCRRPDDDGQCCAQHALDRWRAQRNGSPEQSKSNILLTDWRASWLESSDWRTSTRNLNRERTAAFARAYGDLPLCSTNWRPLARAWVKSHPSHHGSLSAMFGAAAYADNDMGERLLLDNPFSKLVKKTVARRDLSADWLNDDDISTLEEIARTSHGEIFGETMAALIRMAAETMMRPGELFVLEEADLEPHHQELNDETGKVEPAPQFHARRSYSPKGSYIGPPKNGRPRVGYLSRAAIAAAARAPRYDDAVEPVPLYDPWGVEIDNRYKKDRARSFWLPQGTPRIFSTVTGERLTQSALSIAWSPIRNAFGRPNMDFYELRHFGATRLLELGARDDEVAVQLGHTDNGGLVRDTYGHPSNRRARRRVGALLDGQEAA